MRETSKCHAERVRRGEFDRYLCGRGLDIGAGDDPLRPASGAVDVWDLADGDAMLLAGVPDVEFDFVYSSHCLEHMLDIPTALANWARVLKPGGWLYVVVPDYCLYEKLQWPSRYNGDHRASFSLDIPRHKVKRESHYHVYQDLLPLLTGLGLRLELARLEDDGFDYANGAADQTLGSALAQICLVSRKEDGPAASDHA